MGKNWSLFFRREYHWNLKQSAGRDEHFDKKNIYFPAAIFLWIHKKIFIIFQQEFFFEFVKKCCQLPEHVLRVSNIWTLQSFKSDII